MPSWNDIYAEMKAEGLKQGLQLDFDGVRRSKIRAVEQVTGRPLIIYVADMSHPEKTANNPQNGLITLDDIDGFIEATTGIHGDSLDVLLHSPGGSAEATESIVSMLRKKFRHLRFIVPSVAKSAATMLAMSGDQILMTDTAELGPIDPQFILGGGRPAPAQAILDEFEQAKDELRTNPTPAWIPKLQMYGPGLLQQCQNAIALAEQLVSSWLRAYMFSGEANADQHAKEVAKKLNDHVYWRSHGRRIDIPWLTGADVQLNVLDISTDQKLYDAVRALYLAIKITLDFTGAFKIVENGQGKALIGLATMGQITLTPNQPQQQGPNQPSPPSPPFANPSKQLQRLPSSQKRKQSSLTHRQRKP